MNDSKICNIVVLISGSGSNLQAIIDDLADHPNARICAVVSNRADAYGLVRAQHAGITQHVLNHKDFTDRLAFDTALMQVIDQHQPDPGMLRQTRPSPSMPMHWHRVPTTRYRGR